MPLRVNGAIVGDCELCGAMKVSTRQILVNRAKVDACKRCTERAGQTFSNPTRAAPVQPKLPAKRTSGGYGGSGKRGKDIMLRSDKQLRDDFATVIRDARNKFGWEQKELAKRMAERVNIIQHTEGGKRPTDDVIRKFEKILRIQLMVERTSSEEREVTKSSVGRSMTLADYFDQAKDNL